MKVNQVERKNVQKVENINPGEDYDGAKSSTKQRPEEFKMFMGFKVKSQNSSEHLTGLTAAQKTALITSMTLFTHKNREHAGTIFAKFYEENPEYLRLFDSLGNKALHQHSESVLTKIESLVDSCLTDPDKFNRIVHEIVQAHSSITRNDVKKLSAIIKKFILNQVEKNKTKTFQEALDLLFLQIESKFRDS